MKQISVVLGVLLTGVLACGAAGAGTNPPTIVNTNQAASEAFWTEDRLATAVALPLPVAGNVTPSYEIESAPSSPVSAPGGAPTLNVAAPSSIPLFESAQEEESEEPEMFGSSGIRFTSGRLVIDAVASLGGETKYPYSASGQLFFTIPSGTAEPPGSYVCSATVQRIGVITTAGHCVADGHGHFYKNWTFIPARRLSSEPFGSWNWRQVITTATWFSGGGGVPNAQDVAVIVLSPNSRGAKIGSFTGYVGFDMPDLYAGQHLTAIGYPCNLDSCEKDHRVDSQVFGGSNNTDVIGSDMTGGSSGGGWLINHGEYAVGQPVGGASDTIGNALVAVTSYGPTVGGILYEGASVLDGRYVQCTPLNTCAPKPSAILNLACVDNPGFC
jgi:V8-like Glu-specific endopeptidase